MLSGSGSDTFPECCRAVVYSGVVGDEGLASRCPRSWACVVPGGKEGSRCVGVDSRGMKVSRS
jgi:hypothetical protein